MRLPQELPPALPPAVPLKSAIPKAKPEARVSCSNWPFFVAQVAARVVVHYSS
jgi:hypothetical protein